ncbi:putative capsular polysaccharide biosynthesis protein YveQ [Flavobacteriaceae bacterium 3519-10]|nr:putative capsular polysaccharide biosynthesis protein YveQ [Flavobacteriaceae bacterium 3519-10]
MFIYFIILGLVLLLLWGQNSSENSSILNLPALLAVGILIAFAGLRNVNVGTDTGNYVGIYYGYQDILASGQVITSNMEKGYIALMYVATGISTDYWAVLLLTAIICVGTYMYVIFKVSENVALSVFIYVVLGTYLVFFNAARQGLAISICAISVIFLLQRKIWHYIIVIIIASFFHRTALILLPFYFILRLPFSYRNTGIFVVAGAASFYFLSTILSLFDSDTEMRYGQYEERGATGGQLLSLFYILSSALLIYARKFIAADKIRLYDVFLNYSIFTAIIYFVVIATGSDVNFMRLTNYFAVGYVFGYPLILKSLNNITGALVKPLFIVAHLLFFAVYLSRMANLTPYYPNLNLF